MLMVGLLIFCFGGLARVRGVCFLMVILFCFVFRVSLNGQERVTAVLFFVYSCCLICGGGHVGVSFLVLTLILFILSFCMAVCESRGIGTLTTSSTFGVILTSGRFMCPVRAATCVVGSD